MRSRWLTDQSFLYTLVIVIGLSVTFCRVEGQKNYWNKSHWTIWYQSTNICRFYSTSIPGITKLRNSTSFLNFNCIFYLISILFQLILILRVAWKGYFPQRDLIALSVNPLVVYPTHYTGESGYVSDTEDSKVIALQGPQEKQELWNSKLKISDRSFMKKNQHKYQQATAIYPRN